MEALITNLITLLAMVIDMVTGVIIGFATLESTVKTVMLYFAYRHIFVDLYSPKNLE